MTGSLFIAALRCQQRHSFGHAAGTSGLLAVGRLGQGLRYGELLIGDNPQGTAHPRIMMAREVSLPWAEVEDFLSKFAHASQAFDCEAITELLRQARTGYAPNGELADLVWCNGGQEASEARPDGKVLKFGVSPQDV